MLRCNLCGKFISHKDFDKGATRKLSRDGLGSDEDEDYETTCIKCNREQP